MGANDALSAPAPRAAAARNTPRSNALIASRADDLNQLFRVSQVKSSQVDSSAFQREVPLITVNSTVPWGQSVSQLFHGPAPRSPLHRLAVRLRHSRSNTSTEYLGAPSQRICHRRTYVAAAASGLFTDAVPAAAAMSAPCHPAQLAGAPEAAGRVVHPAAASSATRA